jgi:DNA gyrase/topoisomerase IV subunit A
VVVSNGVIDAMYDWIELRKEQFDKAMVWRIAQEEKKLHRVDLQLLAHKKRDVLDACRDKPDPKAYLMKQLGIDDKDADYLLGMTVMQLTRINKEKLEAKAKEHKGQIATFKDERKRPVEGLVKELKQLA